VKVKICGITSYEDAALALDYGADALGFNFYARSPRYTAPAAACSIIRRLPPFAVCVGVFVNEPDTAQVARIADSARVSVVQLHGDESPEYCRKLTGRALVKALRIGAAVTPINLEEYPVQAFLLDAGDDGRFGGTGRTFDWGVVGQMKIPRPVVLAGGLTPDNVARAIRQALPYCVDVCSGVESAPGKKDKAKLAAFMNEVRNAS
jgi:phosphoribosylanthranilate isomerase